MADTAARFRALAEDAVTDLLQLEPEHATDLGDHRYDDRLDDLSEAGLARAVAHYADHRDELDSLDTDDLDPADAVDAEILRAGLDRRVFATGADFGLPLDPAEFAARLGADHVLLVRLHSLVTGRPELPAGPVRDVSGYPDVRDLYLAADLMVTDYSSTMFDFAVTGKPLIFFAYDLDDYRDRVRGFYFDLAPVAPGPVLGTGAEVLDAIADVHAVSAAYAERYRSFRSTFCSLDDGHATARVIDRLFPPGIGAGSPIEAGALHDRE